MTPQFVDVSSTTGLKLKDIKPVAADPSYELSDGDVDIQCFDNGGMFRPGEWYSWDGSKWIYNDDTDPKYGQDASDVVISAGKGISVGCVVGDQTVVTLQSAGQVSSADALVELDKGWGTVLAGNPFPVDITLDQLTLETDVEYELSDGDVDIQFFDNGGMFRPGEWYSWDGSKWIYNDDTDPKYGQDASKVKIPAGEGVSVGCVVGDSVTVTLRIPAPEL